MLDSTSSDSTKNHLVLQCLLLKKNMCISGPAVVQTCVVQESSVSRRICIKHMQILHHFMYKTWVFKDFVFKGVMEPVPPGYPGTTLQVTFSEATYIFMLAPAISSFPFKI